MATSRFNHSHLNVLISSPGLIPSISRLSNEHKDISPDLIVKKRTIYDFGMNNGSLCDLDGHNKYFSRNSLTSTNDGSRTNLDSATLTKNHSIEFDLFGSEEDNKKLSPGKLMGRVSAGEHVVRERNECPEILENSEEEAQNQSIELPSQVIDTEDKTSESEIIHNHVYPMWKHICPKLDRSGAATESFSFYNDDRTVTHLKGTSFSTVCATEPLPNTGKCKFSVKVDSCGKKNPKLYLGVALGLVKDKPLSYKPGYYFLNAFGKECYLNRLHIIKEECFASEGDVITVSIDMDAATISFESEKGKLLEGKLFMSKTKPNQFYPCVALGELGGTISFN